MPKTWANSFQHLQTSGLSLVAVFLRLTKENASLISFLHPVSFELVCLCTAMQNFSRLL